MSTMVDIRGVSKRFGSALAVDAVDLSLAQGEFLTIVGPSGCGKTTLLRMIAGFETPSEGSIRINDLPVEGTPAYRRSIGMVFQGLALFPHMTAAQNVAYPLKMRRFDPDGIADLVDEHLQLVKLGDYANRRPHELSGGQRQRVAIARALSFSPDLLLLDEPLSALDKKLREEMQLEFRRIQQELGVTTINVTHDQREALVMSDQIVVMNAGVVQQADTPQRLYQQPRNRFVAGFIGMTSQFEGTLQSQNEAMLTVDVGGVSLQASGAGDRMAVGQQVDCALRAEQVRIQAEVVEDRHTENADHVDHVDHADHADHAGHAGHADHADHADHAGHADHADHADHAGHANHAASANSDSAGRCHAADNAASPFNFDNVVTGSVEQAIYEGDRVLYAVRVDALGGVCLHVFDHDALSHARYARHQRVVLGWNARDQFAYPAHDTKTTTLRETTP